MFPIQTASERRRINLSSHDLVKTGDPEAKGDAQDNFPPFCDRNGEVVLGWCRRCHGAEVELEEKSCLERLIVRAIEAEAKLPPLQRAINAMHQRRSWVVGESMMNDDASPNGRTREEAQALLEQVAPEFIVLAELERRLTVPTAERMDYLRAQADAMLEHGCAENVRSSAKAVHEACNAADAEAAKADVLVTALKRIKLTCSRYHNSIINDALQHVGVK